MGVNFNKELVTRKRWGEIGPLIVHAVQLKRGDVKIIRGTRAINGRGRIPEIMTGGRLGRRKVLLFFRAARWLSESGTFLGPIKKTFLLFFTTAKCNPRPTFSVTKCALQKITQRRLEGKFRN